MSILTGMNNNFYFKTKADFQFAPPGKFTVQSASPTYKIRKPGTSDVMLRLHDKAVGKLFMRDGKLHFDGDLAASAESLLGLVCRAFNNQSE